MTESTAANLGGKQVFTTGEAAIICQISQQTIIRCFDAGRLKGFKVPGSRFRRIPRGELIRFMRANGMPLDRLDGAGKRRILVVDDNEQIVELFVDILSRDGRFEVHSATTGYEAGVETERFKPELILLDYMLPDLNGTDVCRSIRANPEHRDTKIIIVSGVVHQDEISELMDAGADDFIKKPFNIDKLMDRVKHQLEMV
jgi:CheY-like chemotaxis protein